MQSKLHVELQRLCAPLSTARVDQLMKQGKWLSEILHDCGWHSDEVSAKETRFHDGMLMAAPWAVLVNF